MAKATHLLRKAAELVRQRKYQDAVEAYLQATEVDPRDSRAWFGLGVCLYRVGNLDVAAIALERAHHMGYPRAQEALDRVKAAEEKRDAEGRGAKATISAAEAEERASERASAFEEAPPRAAARAEAERIDLDRFVRVMIIENIKSDLEAMVQAVEGTLKNVEVSTADYGVSTSDTMSNRVRAEVVVLDWDTAPDAAAGLIQILKIKEPALLVVCLTEKWDPETAVQILEAGGDYHILKEPHFASIIPLIIAQWARRDRAVAQREKAREGKAVSEAWPEPISALGAMLMHVAADYTVIQANPAAMKGLRKAEEDLIGKSYSEVFYGEEEPPDECPLLRVLQSSEPVAGQVQPEGLNTSFSVRAWPVLSYSGKVSGAVALLGEAGADAPEAQDLKDREWLYRSLTEGAAAGMAMVDSEGGVQYANGALCDMVGEDEEALIGQPFESLVQPKGRDEFGDWLLEAARTGSAAGQFALEKRNGSGVSVGISAAPLGKDDEALLVLTVIEAATAPEAERVVVEVPSDAGAEGLAGLAAAVPEMLFISDAEGNITWCNPATGSITGYEHAQAVGMVVQDLAASDSHAQLAGLFQKVLAASGQVHREEMVMARRDGRRYWGELSLLSIQHEGKPVVQGALRDVSDRRMTEAIRSVLEGNLPT